MRGQHVRSLARLAGLPGHSDMCPIAQEFATDSAHLHEAISRDCRAQEVYKVGELAALELLMEFDDELQVLGAEARDQTWLPSQAPTAGCSCPACRRTVPNHKVFQTRCFHKSHRLCETA